MEDRSGGSLFYCIKIKNFKIIRAKKRWGQCRKIGNNYIIEVNQILLREDTDIDGLKNTIIHELLHTCKGCMKHTGEWKQLAEKVNRYYGYNIKRCDSADEKGISEEQKEKIQTERAAARKVKYIFKFSHIMQIMKNQTKTVIQ